MSDGILLAPYPVVHFNPFTQVPEHRVAFQSADVYRAENPSPAKPSAAETTATTTVTTNQSSVDAAMLELKAQKMKDRYKDREDQKAIAAEEVDYIKNGQTCLLVCGLFFVFLALAATVVAFGTPEWRIYDVDEPKLVFVVSRNPSLVICDKNTSTSTCQFFTSRIRGLFVTCYSNSSFFSKIYSSGQLASSWLDGYSCVWEQKYNLQSTPITVEDNCDQDASVKNGKAMANMNTNIMRAQWLAFACAIICLLLGFLLSIISFKECRVGGSICAGVFLLFAVILLLIGMVLFHAYIYVEEMTLKCLPFYAMLQKGFYSEVYKNTQVYFGFSFYLGWSGFALAILGCAFIMAAACQRCRAKNLIDKAMHRLEQINKEEKAEKKFEEMEAKRMRKEMKNQMKSPKNQVKAGMSGVIKKIAKMKKKEKPAVSDSEIDYNSEIKSLKRDTEARLRKLKDEAEDQIEFESSKIEANRKKKMEELKRAQRELEDVERRIKMMEREKKKQEKKKPRLDESSTDSDSDEEAKSPIKKKDKGKKKMVMIQRSRSVESVSSVEGKCGRVVTGAVEYRPQTCCDPYTLHLPTGFNPPPYRP